MANCAVQGCFKFVNKDGLAGFCEDHRENAIFHGIEVLENKLNEQKKLIERLEQNQRSLVQQLQQRR